MWRSATKDRNELEIAGELSLALGGFAIPRPDGARQQRIQSRKRAYSISRPSSSKAVKSQSGRNYSGDPPRIRKSISSSRATQNVEVLRLDAVVPSQKSDGAVKNLSILHNSPKIYPLLLAQVNTTIKVWVGRSGTDFRCWGVSRKLWVNNFYRLW